MWPCHYNNDNLGEISKEIQSFNSCFAGFPQEEIVKIFHNCFNPINLYRLCNMCGYHYKSLHNQECIGIGDGILRLRKISGIYKDFGKSFYVVWSKNLYNYITIIVSLFITITTELWIPFTTIFYNFPKSTNGKKLFFFLLLRFILTTYLFNFLIIPNKSFC